MRRLTFLLLAGLLIASLFLTGCSTLTSAMSVELVVGSSDTCTLQQDDRVPISVIGRLPPGATVHWSATGGSVKPLDGLATIFEASTTEMTVTVIAKIDYQGGSVAKKVDCEITPVITPAVEAVVVTEPPPPTATQPLPTVENTPEPAATLPSAPTDFPSLTPTIGAYNVAITEVMANPCGGEKEQLANEYVELFNYGLAAVDLNGWWILSSSQVDLPNSIVAWETRNPLTGSYLGDQLITGSTILQPGQYAVILEPGYLVAESDHPQPYRFPPGTLILTIGETDRLGNKVSGLISSGKGVERDALYIYRGDRDRVIKFVSSYGIQTAGPHPSNYYRLPDMPFEAQRCQSIQRKIPSAEDGHNNWQVIDEGTPGWGP
jgi:hypothetical protein